LKHPLIELTSILWLRNISKLLGELLSSKSFEDPIVWKELPYQLNSFDVDVED